MKNYKRISYVILIIIILILSFTIYKVYGKNNEKEDSKEKTLSEIKHLESNFLEIFNELNNIKTENYKISSSEIKKQNSSNSGSQSSSGSSENSEGSSESESSESSGQSESSESSGGSSNNKSSEDSKKYELKEEGILTGNSEVDWNNIKNQVENVYTSSSEITLDLYQININQQDIVNFNSEYDNLTKAVKEENKENTLSELSKLYDYLPKFIENCTDSENEKTIIKIKNNIFKGYSILDSNDWNSISNYISQAIQETTRMLTNVSNQKDNKQYSINKAYISMNELQNAVNLKDKEIFLIKYKNLLEELQNI